jgi:hypothetical protein
MSRAIALFLPSPVHLAPSPALTDAPSPAPFPIPLTFPFPLIFPPLPLLSLSRFQSCYLSGLSPSLSRTSSDHFPRPSPSLPPLISSHFLYASPRIPSTQTRLLLCSLPFLSPFPSPSSLPRCLHLDRGRGGERNRGGVSCSFPSIPLTSPSLHAAPFFPLAIHPPFLSSRDLSSLLPSLCR